MHDRSESNDRHGGLSDGSEKNPHEIVKQGKLFADIQLVYG